MSDQEMSMAATAPKTNKADIAYMIIAGLALVVGAAWLVFFVPMAWENVWRLWHGQPYTQPILLVLASFASVLFVVAMSIHDYKRLAKKSKGPRVSMALVAVMLAIFKLGFFASIGAMLVITLLAMYFISQWLPKIFGYSSAASICALFALALTGSLYSTLRAPVSTMDKGIQIFCDIWTVAFAWAGVTLLVLSLIEHAIIPATIWLTTDGSWIASTGGGNG